MPRMRGHGAQVKRGALWGSTSFHAVMAESLEAERVDLPRGGIEAEPRPGVDEAAGRYSIVTKRGSRWRKS